MTARWPAVVDIQYIGVELPTNKRVAGGPHADHGTCTTVDVGSEGEQKGAHSRYAAGI